MANGDSSNIQADAGGNTISLEVEGLAAGTLSVAPGATLSFACDSPGFSGSTPATRGRTGTLSLAGAVAVNNSTTNQDAFDEAGGSNVSLGTHAPNTGGSWSLISGTFDVLGSSAGYVNPTGSNPGTTGALKVNWIAVVDSGESNVTVVAQIKPQVGSTTAGVIFRATDAANNWAALLSAPDNMLKLAKRVSGADYVVVAQAALTVSSAGTYTVTVTCSGNSITARAVAGANDTTVSTTDSFNATATQHGFRATTTSNRFYDFRVDSLGDAKVTLHTSEPITDDATSLTVTASAGAFTDGTSSSSAIAAAAGTNNSDRAPCKPTCHVIGVWPRTITDDFYVDVEAVGPAHAEWPGVLGISRVEVTVTRSGTPTTLGTASMTVVDSHAAGGYARRPTWRVGPFDASAIGDGVISVQATAYPVVGVTRSSPTYYAAIETGARDQAWVDPSGVITLSAAVGTAIPKFTRIVGATSGAIAHVAADTLSSAASIPVSYGQGTFTSGETLQFRLIADKTINLTTATMVGTPAWTASSGSLNSSASPYRSAKDAANALGASGSNAIINLKDGIHRFEAATITTTGGPLTIQPAAGATDVSIITSAALNAANLHVRNLTFRASSGVTTVFPLGTAPTNGGLDGTTAFHVGLEGCTTVGMGFGVFTINLSGGGLSGSIAADTAVSIGGTEFARTLAAYPAGATAIVCQQDIASDPHLSGTLDFGSETGTYSSSAEVNLTIASTHGFSTAVGHTCRSGRLGVPCRINTDCYVEDSNGDVYQVNSTYASGGGLVNVHGTMAGNNATYETPSHSDWMQFANSNPSMQNIIAHYVRSMKPDDGAGFQSIPFGGTTGLTVESFSMVGIVAESDTTAAKAQFGAASWSSVFVYHCTYAEDISFGDVVDGFAACPAFFCWNVFNAISGGMESPCGWRDNHFVSASLTQGSCTTGSDVATLFTDPSNHDWTPKSGSVVLDRVASAAAYDPRGQVLSVDATAKAAIGALQPTASLSVTIDGIAASDDGSANMGAQSDGDTVECVLTVSGLVGAAVYVADYSADDGIAEISEDVPGFITAGSGTTTNSASFRLEQGRTSAAISIATSYGDGSFDFGVLWSIGADGAPLTQMGMAIRLGI